MITVQAYHTLSIFFNRISAYIFLLFRYGFRSLEFLPFTVRICIDANLPFLAAGDRTAVAMQVNLE